MAPIKNEACGRRRTGACAVLDRLPDGRFRVALFDREDRFAGFLAFRGGKCAKSETARGAALFATEAQAEEASRACKATECPP